MNGSRLERGAQELTIPCYSFLQDLHITQPLLRVHGLLDKHTNRLLSAWVKAGICGNHLHA